jgi:hypothetical protein
MDSLQDILGQKKFTAPDEMAVIKDYVLRRYKRPCSIRQERDTLILSVRGSALAATIQLERNTLIEACNIKQKLVIRGSG